MKALKKVLVVLLALAVMAPASVLAATPSGQKKGIENATVTASNLTYNGKEQTSKVVVKDGDKVLEEGKDYTITGAKQTDAGDYTVTVTGMGDYAGTASQKYTIKAKSAANVKITTSSTTYNGKNQKVKIVIMDGDKRLKNGVDYTLSSNLRRRDVGKNNIKITFKGNYAGADTTQFKVHRAEQNITVKSTKSVKASSVRRAAKSFKITVGNVKGNAKVSYSSSSKNITVSRNGKITVKKGTKKGTKAKITVKTDYTNNYKYSKKTFVFTVK